LVPRFLFGFHCFALMFLAAVQWTIVAQLAFYDVALVVLRAAPLAYTDMVLGCHSLNFNSLPHQEHTSVSMLPLMNLKCLRLRPHTGHG
jgi:hypothetical protein